MIIPIMNTVSHEKCILVCFFVCNEFASGHTVITIMNLYPGMHQCNNTTGSYVSLARGRAKVVRHHLHLSTLIISLKHLVRFCKSSWKTLNKCISINLTLKMHLGRSIFPKCEVRMLSNNSHNILQIIVEAYSVSEPQTPFVQRSLASCV